MPKPPDTPKQPSDVRLFQRFGPVWLFAAFVVERLAHIITSRTVLFVALVLWGSTSTALTTTFQAVLKIAVRSAVVEVVPATARSNGHDESVSALITAPTALSRASH